VAEDQVEPLLETARALTSDARARGLPVIRVENVFAPLDPGNLFRNGAVVRGSEGAAWDPRAPAEADGIFEKDAPDAFSNDAFDAALRERQVDHLVIAGVFADGCVRWTAKGALNRGYRVTLVRSGVAAGTEEARSSALDTLIAEGVEVQDELQLGQ
jgi:nicotinamidase-related amidase